MSMDFLCLFVSNHKCYLRLSLVQLGFKSFCCLAMPRGLNFHKENVFQKQDMTLFLAIGPSGVRALPLAAGINNGGHYFR